MKGTRVEINLEALSYNYRQMRQLIPSEVKIAAVVKANAYGHDLFEVSKTFELLGVDYIGVANIGEAVSLRKAGIHVPILVMGKTFEEDYDLAVKYEITLTVFELDDVRKLNLNASFDEKVTKVHLKFDTGFNRLGYKSADQLIEDLDEIKNYEFIKVEGLFTHLALKDVDSDDNQFDQFNALLAKIREKGITIPIKHICDSIGTIAYPNRLYDMVRLGAVLYGYCSRKTPFDLMPVMSFKTSVAQVKTILPGEGVSYDYTFIAEKVTKVATLPVGYADGVPRNLSGVGHVVIAGKKAPIIGLICMDQMMVDVSDLDEVAVGDEVVIFDDQSPTLTELAKLAKTNRNELLSRIAIRVPRVILNGDEKPKVIRYLDRLSRTVEESK